jgi:hypothetical protein
MRCETCDILLDADDNYCRNCGAAVRVETMSVVRQTAQPPALFRSTVAPLATGAAAVAATALLRWAIGQAVRGLLTDDRSQRVVPKGRAVGRRDAGSEAVPSGRNVWETVEIFWYRRTGRG